MSPRTGRPKVDNPLGTRGGVRLSKEDQEKLEFCVQRLGVAKSEVLRMGLDMMYQKLKNEK